MTTDKKLTHSDLELNVRPFSRSHVDRLIASITANGFDNGQPIVLSKVELFWASTVTVLKALGLEAPADAPEWFPYFLPVSGWHRLLACIVTNTAPAFVSSAADTDWRLQALSNQQRQQTILRLTGPDQIQATANLIREGILADSATAILKVGAGDFEYGTAQTIHNRARLVIAGLCDAVAACKIRREDAAVAFKAGTLDAIQPGKVVHKAIANKDYDSLLSVAPAHLVPLLNMMAKGQVAMAVGELKAMASAD